MYQIRGKTQSGKNVKGSVNAANIAEALSYVAANAPTDDPIVSVTVKRAKDNGGLKIAEPRQRSADKPKPAKKK